jgi:WD40 repeat protein
VTVPEAAVLRLWMHERSIRDYEASKLLVTLERKALLRLSGKEPTRRVSLHDLQYDYLHGMQQEQLKSLHERLLAAYASQCSNGWQTGPRDGYYFEYLPWHLKEAKRTAELKELLLNFRWLQAKLEATDVNALISDYADLRTVQSMLRQSAHILAGSPRELPGQLLGRLPVSLSPEIDALRTQALEYKDFPWLRPLAPSLTPDASLICVLQGHTKRVTAVALSSDDRRVVSGSEDHTLRVWDLESGQTIRTLQGHTSAVTALALSSDGRRAVSGSEDHTLRVWDLESGQIICTLEGHMDSVNAVALSSDGRRVISGSEDHTLRVWDLESGQTLRTLQGHTKRVIAVALSSDGRRVVSGSWDTTLRVWDLESGQTIRTLQGHTSAVGPVALTSDGRRVVSGSWDTTLRVWDLENGQTIRTLQGHTSAVGAVALTSDGRRVVSGSEDSTLRVWDLKDGKELVTFTVDGNVTACALAQDNRTIVAGDRFGRVHFLRLAGVD